VTPGRRLAAFALAAALLGAATAHADTFVDVLGRRRITQPLADALADSIGRSLPVVAASPGLTFTFDPETHTFERATDVLGQVLLERARPLGRGKWNLSLAYQWVRIDTLDGRDLDSLADHGPPIVDPDTGALFTLPRFALGLETHQVTASVTYGVTDDLDLNLTVPVIYSTFDVHARLRVVGSGQIQQDRAHETAFGAGDIQLRAKQRLTHGRWGDLAAGLVLRLPSGNQENFQGTGSTEVAPMLYGSTASLPLDGPVGLRAYANAGVDLVTDDVDRSEGRYGVGVDLTLGQRATLAVGFLGREPFSGIAKPGFFDVVREDPQSGARTVAPLLGLRRDRASVYDLSLGGRVALWRDTLIGFVNVQLPVNDAGFRSDVIPLVGLEATF
jgi:hypothetical protein